MVTRHAFRRQSYSYWLGTFSFYERGSWFSFASALDAPEAPDGTIMLPIEMESKTLIRDKIFVKRIPPAHPSL